jgi:hypothetical protein
MAHRFVLLTLCALASIAGAQSAPKVSLSPTVRVTLQLDSAATAHFDARGFDLRVSQATGAAGSAASAASTEIQLVKQAGAHTGDLVRLSASGARAPSALIEVLDSIGAPATTLRLTDVTIVSDHLSLSAARANLEQQRISQQEALSALMTDFQEAQRQLSTLEQLGKTRVATPQDLARARDRASDLQRRIELLKERQSLLAGQLAGQGPLEETIILHFTRLDIDSPQPGGRAVIDIGAKPPAKRY